MSRNSSTAPAGLTHRPTPGPSTAARGGPCQADHLLSEIDRLETVVSTLQAVVADLVGRLNAHEQTPHGGGRSAPRRNLTREAIEAFMIANPIRLNAVAIAENIEGATNSAVGSTLRAMLTDGVVSAQRRDGHQAAYFLSDDQRATMRALVDQRQA